jgi:phosphoenolpyruvate synthase/pyruvate phosphate dikinase
MYQRLKALPSFPTIIRGHFDASGWAEDPNRYGDIYATRTPITKDASTVISGSPGSAGKAEGVVRIIADPRDSDQFQQGEILVAVQTDIAWTVLFPRAAAVVTDVGAALSHAAIVARELGIPAVVGCGDATARLKTGNRVRVDGGKGTVTVIG